MSSAGHVFSMIATLKNNARKGKYTFKDLREHYENYRNVKHDPVKTKSISSDELMLLKNEIRAARKKDFRVNLIKSVSLLIIVVFVMSALIAFLAKETADFIAKNKTTKEVVVPKRIGLENELLSKGKEELRNNNYKDASFYFLQVYEKNPDNYEGFYGLVLSSALECANSGDLCGKAHEYYKLGIERYGYTSDMKRIESLISN